MSCVAACVRQYCKDLGINNILSEKKIFEIVNVKNLDEGLDEIELFSILENIFKDKQVIANNYFRNVEANFSEIAKDLSKEGSWIAFIHPETEWNMLLLLIKSLIIKYISEILSNRRYWKRFRSWGNCWSRKFCLYLVTSGCK